MDKVKKIAIGLFIMYFASAMFMFIQSLAMTDISNKYRPYISRIKRGEGTILLPFLGPLLNNKRKFYANRNAAYFHTSVSVSPMSDSWKTGSSPCFFLSS